MAIYDINLKVNNNITEENTVFYKLTAGASYGVNITPYSYTLNSLTSTLTSNIWYTLNNQVTSYANIESTTFNCINPCVCSISITLSTAFQNTKTSISATNSWALRLTNCATRAWIFSGSRIVTSSVNRKGLARPDKAGCRTSAR